MSTAATLVDQLSIVNLKTWYAQDDIYKLRKYTSFEEFYKDFASEDGAKKIWEYIKCSCDLNLQRNALIDELDEKLLEIVSAAVAGQDIYDGRFLKKKHKTY